MSAPAEAVSDQLPVVARGESESVLAVLIAIAGGGSLRGACKENGIDPATFLTWTVKDATLAKRYALARMSQAAVHADEILEIADDRGDDWVQDKDGNWKPDYDHIQRSRLRVDSRKWIAAKLHPALYGDKVEITNKDAPPENQDADAVIDGLVALTVEHPIAALPLRKLLLSALARIPIPE